MAPLRTQLQPRTIFSRPMILTDANFFSNNAFIVCFKLQIIFSPGIQFFLLDFLVGTLVGGVGHGADFLGTSPLASTPNPCVDSDARRGWFIFLTLRGTTAGLVYIMPIVLAAVLIPPPPSLVLIWCSALVLRVRASSPALPRAFFFQSTRLLFSSRLLPRLF